MAERIIRQLIDDLDHTEIPDGKGGTVEFAVRGTTYRIDLTNANAAKLDKALAPFIAAATKISGPRAAAKRAVNGAAGTRPARRAAKRAGAVTTATVRAWATENGHDVNPRGRIPASVTEAYERAHQRTK